MLKLHCTFRVVTHDHEVAWPRPIELSLPTRLEVTNYALGRSFWADSGELEPCGGRLRGHVPRLCLVFGWPMRLLGQEDLFSNWASCIKHVRIVSEGPVRKKVLLPEKVSLKSLEKVSVGPRMFPPWFGAKSCSVYRPLYLTLIDELGGHIIWIWKPWTCSTTQYNYFCRWYPSSTSTSTSNTVAPTATPKVVTLVSTIVFNQRFFLSLLNALGVSIGSIRSPNRSITPLFGSQNIV